MKFRCPLSSTSALFTNLVRPTPLLLLHNEMDRSADPTTLKLVHVVFRHGDRTNLPQTTYKTDPYRNETYYPYGLGQLTNKGKRREYELGKLLRRRYDAFLGSLYFPDIIDAYTSDTNRTQMSLQLVLAGLFPPIGELSWEKGLSWQPIPYSVMPRELDKVFYGTLSPEYRKMLQAHMRSKEYTEEMNAYKKLFQYLSEHTGQKISTDQDIFRLYGGLKVQEEMGFKLPPWTDKVYPHPMKEIAGKSYYTDVVTVQMKRMVSGRLLQKILDDSLRKLNAGITDNRKIILYSGHEFNLAYLLIIFGAFEPHIPPYGGHVIVEVHIINDVAGVKVFYNDYTAPEPRLLTLPGCQPFCPIEDFVQFITEFVPDEHQYY